MEGRDEDERAKMDHLLDIPPATASVEEVKQSDTWSDEAMASDFMASLAARNGGGRLAVDGVRSVDVGGE